MVDPIAIAEQIIGVGLYIKKTIEEVKIFKKHAERMLYRVNQIMPSLHTLANMKSKQKDLHALQKDETRLLAFAKSLDDMLHQVEQVKDFTEELKGMGKFDKFKDKNKIKAKFEDLDWKLGILQDSILFGVLTEVKKEVDSAEIKPEKEGSNPIDTDQEISLNKPDKAERTMKSFVKRVKLTKGLSTENNLAEVTNSGEQSNRHGISWDSIHEVGDIIGSKNPPIESEHMKTINEDGKGVDTPDASVIDPATGQMNYREDLPDMSKNEKVKKILRSATNDVCDNLGIDVLTTMLSSLEVKNALVAQDVQTIKSKTTDEERADEMLRILQKKPVTAYDAFMETLVEVKQQEIYDKIKPLETKYGYNKQSEVSAPTQHPAQSEQTPQPVTQPPHQPAPHLAPTAMGPTYDPAHPPPTSFTAAPCGNPYQGYLQYPQGGEYVAPPQAQHPTPGFPQQFQPPGYPQQQQPPGYQQQQQPPGYQQQPQSPGYQQQPQAPGYQQQPQATGFQQQPQAPVYQQQPQAPGYQQQSQAPGYPPAGNMQPVPRANSQANIVPPATGSAPPVGPNTDQGAASGKTGQKVTEKDIGEVARLIGAEDNVKMFYTHLGIKNRDVRGAEQQSNTPDPTAKARNVLLKWIQCNGKAATRDKIRAAMVAMEEWTELLEDLDEVWNE